jgi:hypothetical protein
MFVRQRDHREHVTPWLLQATASCWPSRGLELELELERLSINAEKGFGARTSRQPRHRTPTRAFASSNDELRVLSASGN